MALPLECENRSSRSVDKSSGCKRTSFPLKITGAGFAESAVLRCNTLCGNIPSSSESAVHSFNGPPMMFELSGTGYGGSLFHQPVGCFSSSHDQNRRILAALNDLAETIPIDQTDTCYVQ